MKKENYEILWEQTFLPELEKTVTSISFGTFIKQLIPVDVRGNKIILGAKTKLFADRVSDDILGSKIREALKNSDTYIEDFEDNTPNPYFKFSKFESFCAMCCREVSDHHPL